MGSPARLRARRSRRRWTSGYADADYLQDESRQITHTPPMHVLDQNRHGWHCGCPELQRRLIDLKPRIHCFGHIHASGGTLDLRGTTFVNASMVDSQYKLTRQPYEFEI